MADAAAVAASRRLKLAEGGVKGTEELVREAQRQHQKYEAMADEALGHANNMQYTHQKTLLSVRRSSLHRARKAYARVKALLAHREHSLKLLQHHRTSLLRVVQEHSPAVARSDLPGDAVESTALSNLERKVNQISNQLQSAEGLPMGIGSHKSQSHNELDRPVGLDTISEEAVREASPQHTKQDVKRVLGLESRLSKLQHKISDAES